MGREGKGSSTSFDELGGLSKDNPMEAEGGVKKTMEETAEKGTQRQGGVERASMSMAEWFRHGSTLEKI